MTKFIAAFAIGFGLIAYASVAEASTCKGLENGKCTTTVGCRWMPERVAGQTLTRKGVASVTSDKAHCRAGSPAVTPVKAN